MPRDSQDEQKQAASDQRPPASKRSYTPKELSPRMRTISLVVGDALCFLIFVTIGANQHNEGFDLGYSLWLAIPFLAAWFLVAPFVGAFRSDVATRPRKMVLRVICSWLASWPVAMFFRWLLVDRVKNPPTMLSSFIAFALVTLIFNMVILLIWRWPFAINNELRRRSVAKTP